jgi:precorrin-6A/cobalt-precorrin-6A reductase
MREHRVDVVVTKDSGSHLTEAKLVAARQLGVPVVVIRRPPLPPGVPVVESVEEALAWVRAR